MIVRWILAALHLLGLAIGFWAILTRASTLRGTLDAAGVRRVLGADNAWGVSALVLISTGLVRAFAGFEKGTAYYLPNHAFWAKMVLLGLILALEVWPMIIFVRWRIAGARGASVDTSRAPTFARISLVQAALLVLMVFAATAMARGVGY